MSDDKQQPSKKIRIPTPKELDESTTSGRSQQDESQEQKGVRSRVRRFRMRMRGGVGRNKEVLKAPRLVGSVKEPTPDRQDPGDVESIVSELSSEPVIGDEGGKEDAVSSENDTGTDPVFEDEVVEEDKQEGSPGERIRTVQFSPELKKRKEEPVPVPEEIPKKKMTLEEEACATARAHAQEYGHDIGDFVPKPFLAGSVSMAECKKCNLNITGVVQFVFKAGLVQVGGTAKYARCKGEVKKPRG